MLQVLAFLPLRSPGKRDDFRLATIGEAAVFFKISPDTIKGWVKRKDRILSDERLPTFKAKWDRLEAELFDAFLTQRSNNKICTVWWFRRKVQTIYETLYPGINPGITSIFLFSNGCTKRIMTTHVVVAAAKKASGS
ncbi:hypothetical protein E4U31_000899 [Claviceps sp. LM219 group G6]|nr:hypothetical protein E4U31_000899 [Claviceps sp. LM219 group G6]